MQTLFNFFKNLTWGQKIYKFQLTYIKKSFNSETSYLTVPSIYFLIFLNLIDLKYFTSLLGGSVIDVISSADIYLYYAIYIKFEFDTLLNLYNSVYYSPITNFSTNLVTNLLNYAEVFLY